MAGLALARPATAFAATLRDVAPLYHAMLCTTTLLNDNDTFVALTVEPEKGLALRAFDVAHTMLVHIVAPPRAFSALAHTFTCCVGSKVLTEALSASAPAGKKRAAAVTTATFTGASTTSLRIALSTGATAVLREEHGDVADVVIPPPSEFALTIATTSARALLSLLREGAVDKNAVTTLVFAPAHVAITGARANIVYPVTPARTDPASRTVIVATSKLAGLLTFTSAAIAPTFTLSALASGPLCVTYAIGTALDVHIFLAPVTTPQEATN